MAKAAPIPKALKEGPKSVSAAKLVPVPAPATTTGARGKAAAQVPSPSTRACYSNHPAKPCRCHLLRSSPRHVAGQRRWRWRSNRVCSRALASPPPFLPPACPPPRHRWGASNRWRRKRRSQQDFPPQGSHPPGEWLAPCTPRSSPRPDFGLFCSDDAPAGFARFQGRYAA